jgi:hypothetical protein
MKNKIRELNMEKNMNNKKKSIFWRIRDIEFFIVGNVCCSLFLYVMTDGAASIGHSLPLFVVITGFGLIFGELVNIALGFNKKAPKGQGEMVFDGGIEELTKQLYNAGLRIKSKTGKFYIFSISCMLLSKKDVVIFKSKKSCVVQSQKIILRDLGKVIPLSESPSESEIGYDYSNKSREKNRCSCDSAMISIVNHNSNSG